METEKQKKAKEKIEAEVLEMRKAGIETLHEMRTEVDDYDCDLQADYDTVLTALVLPAPLSVRALLERIEQLHSDLWTARGDLALMELAKNEI